MNSVHDNRRRVFCIGRGADIFEARAIMVKNNVRHLPVVDEKRRLLGMVSDRDIRTAMPQEAYDHPDNRKSRDALEKISIENIMSRPPHFISTTYTLQDVLIQFREKKVGAFPIVDENRVVVGIISDRDLLHGFIELLGVGSPGCFLGVVIPPSPRLVSRIISAFAEADIAISSMLVLEDWAEEKQALFLYLLTQNIRHARGLISDMGYELIDPMQWFFYRHTTDMP